jgi:cysteine sulfinate desulfinase/cysteine desulfurase-like protein
MTCTQFVGLDAQEGLDMKAFHALLSSKTKLVALPHVSNTLGCINPVKEIVAAAHEVEAVVLVDACQSVPHMKVRKRGAPVCLCLCVRVARVAWHYICAQQDGNLLFIFDIFDPCLFRNPQTT